MALDEHANLATHACREAEHFGDLAENS